MEEDEVGRMDGAIVRGRNLIDTLDDIPSWGLLIV